MNTKDYCLVLAASENCLGGPFVLEILSTSSKVVSALALSPLYSKLHSTHLNFWASSSLENHIIAYSRKALYIIDSKKLGETEKQSSQFARVIKAGKLLGDDEFIKSIAAIHSSRVVIGTSKGMLLLANIL